MKESTAKPSNRIYLLLILVLDVAAFSIIFPLIPAILEHYIETASQHRLDSWLPSLTQYIDGLLPQGYSSPKNRILLIGGFLSLFYSLTLFFCSPYWGNFSDRFGRKPILMLNSLGSVFYGIVWFLSDSFTVFCFARLLGALMGGNLSLASASMADMSSHKKRTSAMGLIGAAFGMGFILGPLLGALSMSWDLGLGDIVSFHPFLGPALLSTILSSLSVLLNIFKFQETLTITKKGSSFWIFNPFLAVKRIPEKGYRRLVLLYSLYFFIFAAYEFCFSFYYSLEFQLSPREIGLLFFYVGCLHILGQGFLVRILSQRLDPHLLLCIGFALQPIPIFFFAFHIPSSLLWFSMLLLVPISLGSSLNTASMIGIASLHLAPQEQGYGLSLLRSFASLSRALAPIITAPLYWFMGAKITYICLGSLLFLLFPLVYRLMLVTKKESSQT